jgi:hypothetical protein
MLCKAYGGDSIGGAATWSVRLARVREARGVRRDGWKGGSAWEGPTAHGPTGPSRPRRVGPVGTVEGARAAWRGWRTPDAQGTKHYRLAPFDRVLLKNSQLKCTKV